MKLYEYQGKNLFQSYNIPIPSGRLIETPHDITKIPLPCAIKSQVLMGGRGKAGGIRFATTRREAQQAIKQLIGVTLRGQRVQKLLVEQKIDIQNEYYLGILLDRDSRCPLLLFSPSGGINIEEVPADKITMIKINPFLGIQPHQLRNHINIDKDYKKQLIPIIYSLYRLFRDNDCELAEINPLALVKGEMIAIDSKIIIDDATLYRHDFSVSDEAFTDLEKEAREKNISFIQHEGSIGIIANGTGLTMATLDAVNKYGGKGGIVVNIGGTDNPEKVKEALLLMKKAHPKVILLNVFGEMTNCGTIARAIRSVIHSEGINCPIVARIKGMHEEDATLILQDHVITTTTLTDAAQKTCQLGE